MKLLKTLMEPWYKTPTLWDVLMIVGMFTASHPLVALILLVVFVANTYIEHIIKELKI